MNLLQISEALKGVPKQFLVQEATQPSGRYPQFMVVAELSRRTGMEKRFRDSIHMGDTPQTTIKDQAIQEATAPMPTSTTMAMGQMQPNMNTGIRSVGAGGGMVNMLPNEPRGQETMGMPAAVRMYEGGRINMDNGGFADSSVRAQNLLGMRYGASARSGVKPEQYYSQLQDELKRLIDEPDDVTASKGSTGRSTLTSQVGTSRIAKKRERINQIYKELSENPNRITDIGGVRAFEQSLDPIGSRSDMSPMVHGDVYNEERLQAQLNDAKTDEERQAIQDIIDRRDRAKADYLKQQATVEQTADDFKKEQDKLETEAPEAPTPETDSVDTKAKLEELKKGLKQPTLDDYKLGEMKFTEVMDSPEAFQARLDGMRKVDYIGKMEANFNKMKEGVEKDKRQALSLSVVEAGLNIATTASPNLLGAIAGGSKAGLKKWTGIQKDVKAAELELTKAENSLLAARDARQEGDIKEYRQHVKEHKAAEREAEKFNINARNKAVELLAADTRNFNTLLNNLSVTTIQQDAANKRNSDTIAMNKYAAELKASTAGKTALAKNIADYQKQLNDSAEKARDRLKDYRVSLNKGTATYNQETQQPEFIPTRITENIQAYINELEADVAQAEANAQAFRAKFAKDREDREANATDLPITNTPTMKGGGFISYPSGGINISRS